MIQHLAICKQCSSQSEINRNAKCFQIVLKSYPLSEHSFNDQFSNNWGGGNKKYTSPQGQVDWENNCFCDKECFIEYLKEKMTDNGMFQMTDEEVDQMEKDNPDAKEFKRIAKALEQLENVAAQPGSPMLGAHKSGK